jgi:hypothetical protein
MPVINSDTYLIKNYIKNYIGYNLDEKSIEQMIDSIIKNKIINSNNRQYIHELLMKFIRFKKKNNYYFVDIKRYNSIHENKRYKII